MVTGKLGRRRHRRRFKKIGDRLWAMYLVHRKFPHSKWGPFNQALPLHEKFKIEHIYGAKKSALIIRDPGRQTFFEGVGQKNAGAQF